MTKNKQIQSLIEDLERIQFEASKGEQWDCKGLTIGELYTIINELGVIYENEIETP